MHWEKEAYQRMGEVLVANQGAVPRGATEVALPDHTGEPGARLAIPLDPTLNAGANVECFDSPAGDAVAPCASRAGSRRRRPLCARFEPWRRALPKRATLPPKDVPPVDLPPAKPDPDQILSRDYAAKTAKDGWSLLTAPTRWDTTDWLIAGGVVAATGGAMLLDTQVRRTAQDNRTHGGDNAAQIVTNLGFILPAAGAVTSYVLGEAFGDEKTIFFIFIFLSFYEYF